MSSFLKPARTIIALAFTALLLAGCGNESATIRYRATAEVVIDGEVRKGSAVREATYTDTPNSLTGFGMSIADRGEAIIVDFDKDHGIYVLRNDRSGSGSRLAGAMRLCFGVDIGDAGWTDGFDALPVGQTCRISPDEMSGVMPLIVAFRSETVPKSIFEVSPETLKSVFGVEGRFQGMTFEKVSRRTPLTKAVDARLPWLNDIPFDGTTIRVLEPYDTTIRRRRSDVPLSYTVTDYYFRE